MTPVRLRPAGFEDAEFLCRAVAAAGGRLARIGRVTATDPYAVLDAVWHRAAAVVVGESDGRVVAGCAVVDLDLLHRTAWLDVVSPPDVDPTALDATIVLTLDHAVRAWNLRTIRTADPVGETPCLAGFGQAVVHEGEIPGRCPGATPTTASVRALWFEDAGPGIPVTTVAELAATVGVALDPREVTHVG